MAHSLSSNDDTPRDIGSVEFSGADVATQLLKAGWAKLKEIKREPTEADLKKREIEAEAKAAGKGIWNPHGPKVRFPRGLLRMLTYPSSPMQAHAVHYMMPEDSQGFITEWKGKAIDGMISLFY